MCGWFVVVVCACTNPCPCMDRIGRGRGRGEVVARFFCAKNRDCNQSNQYFDND